MEGECKEEMAEAAEPYIYTASGCSGWAFAVAMFDAHRDK
jgi:hypothetical protein